MVMLDLACVWNCQRPCFSQVLVAHGSAAAFSPRRVQGVLRLGMLSLHRGVPTQVHQGKYCSGDARLGMGCSRQNLLHMIPESVMFATV
jgi:hypothetical protein